MNRIHINRKSIFYLLILISLTISGKTQSLNKPEQKISLLFIGDIMGHDEQIWSAENRETHTYNYDDVFQYIKPVISESDIAIANFEVTLDGVPYIGYPQFSSPASLASACKNAGYYLTWVYCPIEKHRKKKFILPCAEFENEPGFFSNPSDYILMKKFINDSRALLNKQNINIKENTYNENAWSLNN